MKLDPDALHFARVLYRLVRWKVWWRRKERERQRIYKLHRLPDPKYWPGQLRNVQKIGITTEEAIEGIKKSLY